MITAEEERYFFELAHIGKEHSDPNFVVHGQLLYDDLRHWQSLTKISAKDTVENRIRKTARQIERDRTSYL